MLGAGRLRSWLLNQAQQAGLRACGILRWLFPLTVSDQRLLASAPGHETTAMLVDGLRSRAAKCFLIGAESVPKRADYIRTVYPQHTQRVLEAAARYLEHEVDILGSGPVNLGPQIDWLYDFVADYGFAPGFFRLIECRDLDMPYDVKRVWDLNRCHHWVTLAQAQALSGDPCYGREIACQLQSWLDQNPVEYSVNWVNTMEVGIRLVNWVWTYYLLALLGGLPDDTGQLEVRWLKSMLLHATHIVRYPERRTLHPHSSNHYIANLVGLHTFAAAFPEFVPCAQWEVWAQAELAREVLDQIYPDGAHFEGAIGYHRLVAECLYHAVALAAQRERPFAAAVQQRLERMADFILAYLKPDGTAPLIGDSDDGRLLELEGDLGAPDHRGVLGVAGVLFERADCLAAAGPAQAVATWWFGPAALPDTGALPLQELQSQGFADSGIYVMRARDCYVIVDAGGDGLTGTGSHPHNDTLSFEFYDQGLTWIVDPGTYMYTGDWQARNRFRSTSCHNTLMIDGEEMNRFDERKIFSISYDAVPRVLTWRTMPEHDELCAEHTGYARLPGRPVHRRHFHLDKQTRTLVIRDHVLGTGHHEVSATFCLAPVKPVLAWHDGLVTLTARSSGACLTLVTGAPDKETWQAMLAPREQSLRYGERHPIVALRLVTHATLPLRLVTVLRVTPQAEGIESPLEDCLSRVFIAANDWEWEPK